MDAGLKHVEKELSLLTSYVELVLGDTPAFSPWDKASSLPYYLHDAYSFFQMRLIGQNCIVLMQNLGPSLSIPDVKKHMSGLRKVTEAPLIFVTQALASFERKRLIEGKVQFIVPGNQLFVPELGVDLREYFRARLEKIELISPATQAMLIHQLMNAWEGSLQLSERSFGQTLGQGFGYSKMTVSRAVKELKELSIFTIDSSESAGIHIEYPARTLWRNARKHMRSPMKKSVWLDSVPEINGEKVLIAGESALAEQTMLATPALPVYACSSESFVAAQQSDSALRVVDRTDAVCELQLWAYAPMKFARAGLFVDPFSLILSLQDNKDERIGLSVSELEDAIAW